MARRLNIERRRKRIRHYAARRRRRSPLRRAILFWWSSIVVLGVTLLFLAKLTVELAFYDVGKRPTEAYRLPPATLQLVYASQAEINERLRMGNARRIAVAMSDADIGLSLDVSLPEPSPLTTKALPPLTLNYNKQNAVALSSGELLPRAYTPEEAADAERIKVTVSDDLVKVKYALGTLPECPKDEPAGRAVFWVRLDDNGRPETVLRVSPLGEETPWQRALRVHLGACTGTAWARGRITIYWTAEEAL